MLQFLGFSPSPVDGRRPAFMSAAGESRPSRASISSAAKLWKSLADRSKSGLLSALRLLNGRMVLALYVNKVNRGRREGEAEIGHGVRDDLRHREIAEPLVVRRDHIPRRRVGAGCVNRVLERVN